MLLCIQVHIQYVYSIISRDPFRLIKWIVKKAKYTNIYWVFIKAYQLSYTGSPHPTKRKPILSILYFSKKWEGLKRGWFQSDYGNWKDTFTYIENIRIYLCRYLRSPFKERSDLRDSRKNCKYLKTLSHWQYNTSI